VPAVCSRTRHTHGDYGGTARARAGILIRNAEALETFGKVDTLIIDKTEPLPKATDAEFRFPAGIDESGLLQLVAALSVPANILWRRPL